MEDRCEKVLNIASNRYLPLLFFDFHTSNVTAHPSERPFQQLISIVILC